MVKVDRHGGTCAVPARSLPMTPPSARVGFCCRFVPPDGDREALRRLNPTSTTIAALSRRDRVEVLAKVLDIVRHNVEALVL